MGKFVSRAGEKLDFALREFEVSVDGLVCADFGASTGGFVDCLLQHGAQRVYAVETGYGVLDWRLRNDDAVVVFERTNAIHVELPEKVDVVTIDAGWTRLSKIVPNARRQLKPGGVIVALIKPHYEAGPARLKRGALEPQLAREIAEGTVADLGDDGFKVLGPLESPIQGGKAGNLEYLIALWEAAS